METCAASLVGVCFVSIDISLHLSLVMWSIAGFGKFATGSLAIMTAASASFLERVSTVVNSPGLNLDNLY